MYRHARAASPGLDISEGVACSCRKIPACFVKCMVVKMCLIASSLRVLNTGKVIEPWIAFTNNIVLQTVRPNTLCTNLMFQHRGFIFVPDLISSSKSNLQES